MRFASTSHPGTVALRRFVVPIAITAMLGAALTGGLFALVSRVHAAGPAPIPPRGCLTPAGTSGSLTQSTAPLPGNAIVKGARPLHGSLAAPALASQANTEPSAATAPLHDQQGGELLSNFNGVSSRDSGDTNFGAEFEPPDQGLCVGNGFVVEPVNSAYSIYRTNGKLVAGPFNVNVLFGEGLTEFTSDPRCYFDKATNTWFAIILFIATTPDGNFGDNARTDIAVNTSGDPTTPWTRTISTRPMMGRMARPIMSGAPVSATSHG